MSYRFKGLGQTAKPSAPTEDRTVSDWTAAARAGGDIVSGIIRAATSPGAPTTPAAEPTYAEPAYYPTAYQSPSDSSWVLPVVIGGMALLGIGAFVMMRRRPVSANKRRKRRRSRRSSAKKSSRRRGVRGNYAYEHISHPDKYPVRKNRITKAQRARMSKKSFVFPSRRAWPINNARRTRMAANTGTVGWHRFGGMYRQGHWAWDGSSPFSRGDLLSWDESRRSFVPVADDVTLDEANALIRRRQLG